MIVNATITVYNRYLNSGERLESWKRTVIHDVWHHANAKIQLSDSGVKSADMHKIRIPLESPDKPYLSPLEFATAVNKDAHWTIANDDIIVIGECNIDINKPSDLSKQGISYIKVSSWSYNTVGSNPHWRIEGV